MDEKTLASLLSLKQGCPTCGLQTAMGVRLPVCYLPSTDTIRCCRCSWWLSEALIINNISTYHCSVRYLILFRSQVSILIWLLKVIPHLGINSHLPCHALQSAVHLRPSSAAERAIEGPKPCFPFSCQLILIIKVKKFPHQLLYFLIPAWFLQYLKRKKNHQKKKLWMKADCSVKSGQMTTFFSWGKS